MHLRLLAVAAAISLSSAYVPLDPRTIIARNATNQTVTSDASAVVTVTEEPSVVSVVSTVVIQSPAQPSELPTASEPSDTTALATAPENAPSPASTTEEEGHVVAMVAHVENSAESLDMPTVTAAVGVAAAVPQTAPLNPASALLLLGGSTTAVPLPGPSKSSLAAATGAMFFVNGQGAAPSGTAIDAQAATAQNHALVLTPTVLLVNGVSMTVSAASVPSAGSFPASSLTIGGQTFPALYTESGPIYAINGQALTPGAPARATIGGTTYIISLSSDSSSVFVVTLNSDSKPISTSTQILSNRPPTTNLVSSSEIERTATTSSAEAEQTSKTGHGRFLETPTGLACILGVGHGLFIWF